MLVLHRKPGSRIYIGDDVRIHIISVHEDNVRIGIEAPREIEVYREEILEKYDMLQLKKDWINKLRGSQ